MNIAGKTPRPGRDALIVAEIGVNHDGSADRAIEIIDQLHASGAKFDAVKVQYYTTESLCSSAVPDEVKEDLSACELWVDDVGRIIEHAHKLGYAGIVTVFNVDDFKAINGCYFVDAWKIASSDAINEPLIAHVCDAARFKPIIVSTGTCTADETDRLAYFLDVMAPNRHVMLECTSEYPASGHTAGTVTWMSIRYRSAVIGYSNHWPNVIAGKKAAEAGACIIETHVMHADGQGLDSAVSFTPEQFERFCACVRAADEPFLWDRKTRYTREQSITSAARQSIVMQRDVPKGGIIELADMEIKRPGTGLGPGWLYTLVGAKAARDIKANVPVVVDDVIIPAQAAC